MHLKLYGRPLSTATRRAAVVLVEKGIPFELVSVDTLKGEQKAPEYMERHPFGQIPLLDDNGFLLYESRAICRYIAEKYANQGAPLVPSASNLRERALFEQAASCEMSNFDVYANQAYWATDGIIRRGMEPNMPLFRDMIDKLGPKLDGYESVLSKQRFISGDEISLVDLFHLPFGSFLKAKTPELFASRPQLTRWFEEISARPSWQVVKDGVPSRYLIPVAPAVSDEPS